MPQTLVSFSLTHGGRTYNIAAPPRQAVEGLAVPPPRPAASESGRIFFILIDDLHLDFRDTARVRDLLKRISSELVHEGDMFGIVSTGPSAIEINLTYDRRRLDEAGRKLSGSALSPGDIISTPGGAGPTGSPPQGARRLLDGRRRHPAARRDPRPTQGLHLHQQRLRPRSLREDAGEERSRALRRASRQCRQQQLERSGPPPAGQPVRVCRSRQRAGRGDPRRRARQRHHLCHRSPRPRRRTGSRSERRPDGVPRFSRVPSRTACGCSPISPAAWPSSIRTTSRRRSAASTRTSDYYLLGYYSSNPDPTKKRRTIEVKVKRPGTVVWHRPWSTLK